MRVTGFQQGGGSCATTTAMPAGILIARYEDPNLFFSDPAQLKKKSDPDPALIQNEKKGTKA